MAGLAELLRLSLVMPQEQARLTPGTAISAMQVNLAVRDGCLVIWKKNRPEDFKTAEDLVLGDRGGFIFEPEVGLHEGLYELDFSALYPSIMAKYNISPECLDCSCCGGSAFPVPGLKYRLCTSRVGLIPRVLKPILERRRYYKKMKREPGPLEEVYRDRDAILKWLLVTTFSVTQATKTPDLEELNVTRQSTQSRGPPSSARGRSRRAMATTSSTVSWTPCGSTPARMQTRSAPSSTTSRARRDSQSSSRGGTSGSRSFRARRRASAH